MNRIILKMGATIGIAGVSILVLSAIACVSGARINTTKSIPVGLYWTDQAPIEKGAYVLFCPPKSEVFDTAKKRGYIGAGFCHGDYGYMMKRILAAKNDTISSSDDGVRVNNKLIPLSTPHTTDLGGRLLPRYNVDNYTLNENELLLMSDISASSFDGRYFGLLDRSQIRTVLRPVITW
jgi:conjugative transfer signal peptidase TraF